MRVTKGSARATSPTNITQSRPRSNQVLQVGLLVLVFVLGFVISQQGWHRPLTAFAAAFIRRPAFTVAALSHRSDLPTLHVDLRFREYQRLLDKRVQALGLGANVASDQDYVPASIHHADATVSVQMRLVEGPAEDLSGEAWPLEVAVEGSGTLLGLRRFTLTPADATALSTWGYLETLRQTDLLTPRYHLIRLILNGSPRGFYTLEEQPTPESLAEQGRACEAIAYFDPSAYWEAYARLGDVLPGSGFQYAQVAVDCSPSTRDQTAASDSVPGSACIDAARLLREVQAGDLAPSDLFDAEKTGAFLALTTLWHGTSELDWRTTHLAYDPGTGDMEPVGAGASFAPVAPLPQSLIDDPDIQVAYARALARFSQPDYLTRLQADLSDNLEAMQLALGIEMGYLEFPWPTLEAHQAAMRRLIAPTQPLLAYVEADDAALVLRLRNVQPFPVVIAALDIGENALLAVDLAWVTESNGALLADAPEAAGETGIILRTAVASMPPTIHLRVPLEALPAGYEWIVQSPDQVYIITHLLGLEGQNIAVAALLDEFASPADAGRRSP